MKTKINPEQNISNISRQENKAPLLEDRLIHQQQQYRQLLKEAVLISQKSFQQRTNIQSLKINKFYQKVNFFKQLQKYFSIDFVKSLLKYGKVICIQENHLLVEQNQVIDYFIFGLTGQFGFSQTQSPNNLFLNGQQQHQAYFEAFKRFSVHYLQLTRKKQYHLPKNFSTKRQDLHKIKLQETFQAKLSKQIMLTSHLTFVQSQQFPRYPHKIIALDKQNYIFYIDMKRICSLMKQQYDKTIQKQIQLFLTFGCFKLFKKQKIRRLVEDLQLKTMKKHQIIFKQGDKNNREMFILTKGQVSLEKKAQLGKQNPNKLYKNRLSLQRQEFKTSRKHKIKIIPYADFSKVYNANIQVKKLRLTTISPISIFGEEQIISNAQKRQTTAKVKSQNATIYRFNLEFISSYITKDSNFTIQDFLKKLEQQITDKKILYRQDKLGEQVQFLNKSVNNGFYINQTPKRLSRQSIKRLNKTLSVIKPVQNVTAQQNDIFLTASFTNHNFQQYYQSKRQTSIPLQDLKLQNPIPVTKKSSSRSQKFKIIQYSQAEKQVIKLLHLNERINSKIIGQFNHSKSQKLTPSFSIDIDKPLFTPEYFLKQSHQSKRLQKQAKNSKLKSLYTSTLDSRRKYIRSKTLQKSIQLQSPSLLNTRQYSYQL